MFRVVVGLIRVGFQPTRISVAMAQFCGIGSVASGKTIWKLGLGLGLFYLSSLSSSSLSTRLSYGKAKVA